MCVSTKFTALLVAVCATVTLVSTTAFTASVPAVINYQGRLMNGSGGDAPNGLYDMQFRIYDDSIAGAALWVEIRNGANKVQVTNGMFAVALGRVSNDPLDIFASDANRFLGITVAPDGEMPRVRLMTVPYAFHSLRSDTAAFALNATSGAFLPLSGGTMTGPINYSGFAPITMSRGNFGSGNTNTGSDAFVAGQNNSATGDYSAIVGGFTNAVTGNFGSVIAGGTLNSVSGTASFVAGGQFHDVQADYSISLGRRGRIQSGHNGCFLFSDASTQTGLFSGTSNEFRVRAIGGYVLYTGIDGSGFGTTGVQLFPGGGSWSSLSDSGLKANVIPVDGEVILESLSRIPVAEWNYESQDPSIRHIGPMAQDFYSAFGVGEDERHITSADADGVALAAIQALYRKTIQLDSLQARVNSLEVLLERLQSVIDQKIER